MKAIRQDLTLQNIKDAFAAEVYESHARLALENRDYSNYKQCQVCIVTTNIVLLLSSFLNLFWSKRIRIETNIHEMICAGAGLAPGLVC